jgi:hypothetical protein
MPDLSIYRFVLAIGLAVDCKSIPLVVDFIGYALYFGQLNLCIEVMA